MTIITDTVTIRHMIKNFRDKDTQQLFTQRSAKKIPADIQRAGLRKLLQLHAAAELAFLRVPPGNRLEALKGDRVGQYSIRINDQWRICFVWENGDAYDVEITDYH